MIESEIRGGVSTIIHRNAEANCPCLSEKYDKTKNHNYITNADTNLCLLTDID